MPNWTDDSGFSWFGILECQRCGGRYEAITKEETLKKKRKRAGEIGEIPEHKCIDGIWTSETDLRKDLVHHVPKFVRKS